MPTNRSTTKLPPRRILNLSFLSSLPGESRTAIEEELDVKEVETLDLSVNIVSNPRAAECGNSNDGCQRHNIDTNQKKGNTHVHMNNSEISMSALSVTDIAESKSMKVIRSSTLALTQCEPFFILILFFLFFL